MVSIIRSHWIATALAILVTVVALAKPTLAATPQAGAELGKAAPVFSATDTRGQPVDLAALRGRTVVLEWSNHDCPFVMKHYRSGNMQAQQKAATADGVVWITVVSSAPGTQGHVDAAQADQLTIERKAAPSHVVLDPEGAIGRLYGARVTPHMYVIDGAGTLVYKGGIDSIRSADTADIETAVQYVPAALADLKAGRPVATPISQPYGCSIKYAPGA